MKYMNLSYCSSGNNQIESSAETKDQEEVTKESKVKRECKQIAQKGN